MIFLEKHTNVTHLSLVDVERPAVALLVIVDHGAEIARDSDTLAAGEDAALA